MTKAEALRRARRHLSYGHFRQDGTTVWCTCPEDRAHRVTATHLPWQVSHPHLRAALVAHLREEH